MADCFVTSTPSVRLRGVVDRYVGYRVEGCAPGVHRGLPSGYQTFIVSVGAPIDVIGQTDPAQSPAVYRAVLSGLQASAALIAYEGTQEGVAIELSPVGCRAGTYRGQPPRHPDGAA